MLKGMTMVNDLKIKLGEENEISSKGFNLRNRLYSMCYGRPYPPCPSTDMESYYKMSPLKRWKLYGDIPWTMIIQISLMFLFTIQLHSSNWGAFYQADIKENMHHALFASIGASLKYQQGEVEVVYYNGESVLTDMKTILKNYYEIEESYLGMKLSKSISIDNPYYPPEIKVASYDPTNETLVWKEYQSSIDDPLGNLPICIYGNPSNTSGSTDLCHEEYFETQDFFIGLDEILLSISLYTQVQSMQGGKECYKWNITLTYDYSYHHAYLRLRTDHEVQYCNGFHLDIAQPLLDSSVTALALLSLFLSLRALFMPLVICNHYNDVDEEFSKMRIYGKLSFILNIPVSSKSRLYLVLTAMGSISTLILTTLKAIYLPKIFSWGPTATAWMGVAAFLNYLLLPLYLYENFFHKVFFEIVKTLKIAVPHMFHLLVCFIPVMLGYVLVGTMMFGHFSPQFSTIGSSAITLFAVANGDEISSTVKSLERDNRSLGFFGAIYVVSFICLFIYVVLAIVISIIQKTYAGVSRMKQEESPTTNTLDPVNRAINSMKRISISSSSH